MVGAPVNPECTVKGDRVAKAMARPLDTGRQKGRPKEVSTIPPMARFLKKLQPSIVQISMVVPQYQPPCPKSQKAAYRCGAIAGTSSVLALDFTMRKAALEIGSEPKGLRDDWIAIGNDFRVVSERVKREIERDELPQGRLLEHVPGD